MYHGLFCYIISMMMYVISLVHFLFGQVIDIYLVSTVYQGLKSWKQCTHSYIILRMALLYCGSSLPSNSESWARPDNGLILGISGVDQRPAMHSVRAVIFQCLDCGHWGFLVHRKVFVELIMRLWVEEFLKPTPRRLEGRDYINEFSHGANIQNMR